eukprot:SAG22_NODE_400_length_11089_cov_6.934668_10_plen_159_part_01
MDFMATVLEVLGTQRPASQAGWAFDGVSVLPILRGETPEVRGIGWMYMTPTASPKEGYAYRFGKWKLAVGGISCHPEDATFDCSKPQLYDMVRESPDDEEPCVPALSSLSLSLSLPPSLPPPSLYVCVGGGGGASPFLPPLPPPLSPSSAHPLLPHLSC